MNYKLMEEKSFRVIGKEVRVSTRDGENFKRIPTFWSEIFQDGTCNRMVSLSDAGRLLGVTMDFDPEQEQITYMVAVKSQAASIPSDFIEKEIPASTWAVFEVEGAIPESIQKVWERIFSEWFPATGYEHAGTPDLEVYPEGDSSSPEYQCQIWIPIIKK